MIRNLLNLKLMRLNLLLIFFLSIISSPLFSQIIISQVYEGTSSNKWIEITNVGATSVDLSLYKLGIWTLGNDTGNGAISGAASNTLTLSGMLTAGGKYLMRNSSASATVPHNPMPTANNSNSTVAGFNGNDALALLNASDNSVYDAFGVGINNKDISYHRNPTITVPNATFTIAEWTSKTLAEVAAANNTVSEYIGTHIYNSSTPLLQTNPTSLSGLNYITGNGPSAAMDFELTGSNLNGSDVILSAPANFEISEDEILGYSGIVTLASYNGSSKTIYVRLITGLSAGSYNDGIAITGGGISGSFNFSVSGVVSEPFILPYSNTLIDAASLASATSVGFILDNITSQTAGGGYARFETLGSYIETPSIDFTSLSTIQLNFSLAKFGSGNLLLDVYVSGDDGVNYNLVTSIDYPTTSTYENFYIFIGVSNFNSMGKIKLVRNNPSSTAQIRFKNLFIDGFAENAVFSSGSVEFQNLIIGDGALIECQNTTISVTGVLNRMGPTGHIIVQDEFSYLILPNVGATEKIFPVGTSNTYLPLTLSNSGTPAEMYANVISGVNICSGADPVHTIPATWDIYSPDALPENITMKLDFNNAVVPSGFVESAAKIVHCGAITEVFGSVSGGVATGTGGFSSFSPFLVSSDPIVLPITLIDFNATKFNSKVVLNWSTSDEVDNDFFEIERSLDGKNFESIGKVKSNSNPNKINYYKFLDDKPSIGKNFYRLKQVDINRNFTYSEIRHCKIDNASEISIIQENRNVFISNVISNSVVKIFSSNGNLVLNQKINGDNNLDLSSFTSGLYFLKVGLDENVKVQKLILR